jgi:hypothetical protein
MSNALTLFVTESNKIEGILREPFHAEIEAHIALLERDVVQVEDLQAFVGVVQPNAMLRATKGLDVYVGDHVPPPGGPDIVFALTTLLRSANDKKADVFLTHCAYEDLHPFTDGNGRSGRALWLWMMLKRGRINSATDLGFLHVWYYQSLAASRE